MSDSPIAPELTEADRLADERADRGFRALTRHYGSTDWKSRVDPDNLDIMDPFLCVLAQATGGYILGQRLLGLDFLEPAISEHGFCTDGTVGISNRVLVAAWRRRLAAA